MFSLFELLWCCHSPPPSRKRGVGDDLEQRVVLSLLLVAGKTAVPLYHSKAAADWTEGQDDRIYSATVIDGDGKTVRDGNMRLAGLFPSGDSVVPKKSHGDHEHIVVDCGIRKAPLPNPLLAEVSPTAPQLDGAVGDNLARTRRRLHWFGGPRWNVRTVPFDGRRYYTLGKPERLTTWTTIQVRLHAAQHQIATLVRQGDTWTQTPEEQEEADAEATEKETLKQAGSPPW